MGTKEITKKKIAVFDFCGTFVNFQTADAFIKWCLSKANLPTENKRKISAERFFDKTYISTLFSIFDYSIRKRLIASQVKGLSEETISESAISFIKEMVIPNIVDITRQLYFECKKKNYYLILVSGAYNQYLCVFNSFFHFDKILSTELEIKRGVATGKIKNDCMGKKKAKKLKSFLNKQFGKNNYEICFSIGDSKSDLPVLKIAKRKVVVSNKDVDWAQNGYEVYHGY